MWIDIHAHLYDLDKTAFDAVLQEASDNDVSTIVDTATDLRSAGTVVQQCAASPILYGAVGVSPFDSPGVEDGWIDGLRFLLKQDRIIAIGEIGLDNSNPRYPALDQQLPIFEKQLDLAAELSVPVIIHSRGAESVALKLCREKNLRKVLFHCFTGNRAVLDEIITAGYSISFSGIVTFKNNAVRNLVPIVPQRQLFIETDTPYLAPVPHRGEPNRPAWVGLVGEEIAALTNRDSMELQQIIAGNFRRLFVPSVA